MDVAALYPPGVAPPDQRAARLPPRAPDQVGVGNAAPGDWRRLAAIRLEQQAELGRLGGHDPLQYLQNGQVRGPGARVQANSVSNNGTATGTLPQQMDPRETREAMQNRGVGLEGFTRVLDGSSRPRR